MIRGTLVILSMFMLAATLALALDGEAIVTEITYGRSAGRSVTYEVDLGKGGMTLFRGQSLSEQGWTMYRANAAERNERHIANYCRFLNAGYAWNRESGSYVVRISYCFFVLAFAAYPCWWLYRRWKQAQTDATANPASDAEPTEEPTE